MSIQEMKSRIHQLVDCIDDEPVLEQLLSDVNQYASNIHQPLATLEDLTAAQRERLDQAIQQHKDGKTVSHEEMKQQHGQWLNR